MNDLIYCCAYHFYTNNNNIYIHTFQAAEAKLEAMSIQAKELHQKLQTEILKQRRKTATLEKAAVSKRMTYSKDQERLKSEIVSALQSRDTAESEHAGTKSTLLMMRRYPGFSFLHAFYLLLFFKKKKANE